MPLLSRVDTLKWTLYRLFFSMSLFFFSKAGLTCECLTRISWIPILPLGWLVGWVLWHKNDYRLFNAKSSNQIRMISRLVTFVTLVFSFFSFLLLLLRIYYYYYYSLIRAFHTSFSRWFFTGAWVTASLLKSPGLFSVFWLFLIMLSFGWSPLVRLLPTPPVPFWNPLATVPNAPIKIGIIVTFMFHSFSIP